jgi:hypothetical protein
MQSHVFIGFVQKKIERPAHKFGDSHMQSHVFIGFVLKTFEGPAHNRK